MGGVMHLYSDTDGPKIEPAVLKRLERLDSKLHVTFSKFLINTMTSEPQPVHVTADWLDYEDMSQVVKRGSSLYVLDPGYHLWLKNPNGRYYHVNAYSAEAGFGHREVYTLEADVARWFSAQEILNKHRAIREAKSTKTKADHGELRRDIVHENESRIHDLLFGDKDGRRQAKIVSYPGQHNRSTPGDIQMDSKEDGWVKPENPA